MNELTGTQPTASPTTYVTTTRHTVRAHGPAAHEAMERAINGLEAQAPDNSCGTYEGPSEAWSNAFDYWRGRGEDENTAHRLAKHARHHHTAEELAAIAAESPTIIAKDQQP